MANIFFISLGCDKNRIDSEIMLKKLSDGGHSIVADVNDADCAVVNTCGFIESAKTEAIDAIFEMVRAKEAGTIKAVVVTGCLAERYKEELHKLIPEADAVIGLCGNADILNIVNAALEGEKTYKFGKPEELVIEGGRLLSTLPHYAYLKLAEGCSNHCTYCAIPSIRGAYRSRPKANILAEARSLLRDGVRELILIAQDTTSYGKDIDGGESLASLLTSLCEIEGDFKLRVLYAYPERITDELIEVMAREEKIAKYLDIPLQHASGAVLKRMGRFGDSRSLLALIERLRARIPDITLRSTFIVGFPGETEEQFAELIAFIKTARLDRAGCFEFSAEEGTPAVKLIPQIDNETKARRAESFRFIQSEITIKKNEEKIGRSYRAICDGFDKEKGMFACRGDADAPEIDTLIYLPLESDLMVGEVYEIKVTGADDFDLLGELIR